MINNFKFWHDEIADMPEKVDGRWVDMETGIAYRADYNYAGEQQTSPRATLSQKALDARNVAKAFGGKALTGSSKQKEWAEKLRAEVLKQVTLEQAKLLCDEKGLGKSAHFWIENRNKPASEFGVFIEQQKALLSQALALKSKGDSDGYKAAAARYNELTTQWGF